MHGPSHHTARHLLQSVYALGRPLDARVGSSRCRTGKQLTIASRLPKRTAAARLLGCLCQGWETLPLVPQRSQTVPNPAALALLL